MRIRFRELKTLLLRFYRNIKNMIKHSKNTNDSASKMCIHLREMLNLLLHFYKNQMNPHLLLRTWNSSKSGTKSQSNVERKDSTEDK